MLADVHEATADLPFLSKAHIEKGYENFLNRYSSLIERHLPKLKERFSPYTSGPVGLLVERNDMGNQGSLGSGHWFAFRPLSAGESPVIIVDQSEAEKNEEGRSHNQWHRYRRKFQISDPQSWGADPGLHMPSSRAALRSVMKQLQKIYRERELFEPLELLREKAYCEAAVIYQAITQKPAPARLELADLRQLLDKHGGRRFRSTGRRFRAELEPMLSTQINGRKVRLPELQRTLQELQARHEAPSVLEAPLQPLTPMLGRRSDEGPLSEEEREVLKDWATEYQTKRYENVYRLISACFPTTKKQFGAYNAFPLKILLNWRPLVRNDWRTRVSLGPIQYHTKVESQEERVSVDYVTRDEMKEAQESLASQGLVITHWAIDRQTLTEPLRTGVYRTLKDDIKKIEKGRAMKPYSV